MRRKSELEEVIDFLRNPKKTPSSAADSQGMLLVGLPNGKTL
jgi:ATP-dependent Zn protease